MANRSDRELAKSAECLWHQASIAEWNPARGYHQGQRSVTAPTGRTQDCTRPMPNIKSPLATREPSTQDIRCWITRMAGIGGDAGVGAAFSAFEFDFRYSVGSVAAIPGSQRPHGRGRRRNGSPRHDGVHFARVATQADGFQPVLSMCGHCRFRLGQAQRDVFSPETALGTDGPPGAPNPSWPLP
jgi:hypothetical protein